MNSGVSGPLSLARPQTVAMSSLDLFADDVPMGDGAKRGRTTGPGATSVASSVAGSNSTAVSAEVQCIVDALNRSLGCKIDNVAKLVEASHARLTNIEKDVTTLKDKAKTTEEQLADLARRTEALEKGGVASASSS